MKIYIPIMLVSPFCTIDQRNNDFDTCGSFRSMGDADDAAIEYMMRYADRRNIKKLGVVADAYDKAMSEHMAIEAHSLMFPRHRRKTSKTWHYYVLVIEPPVPVDAAELPAALGVAELAAKNINAFRHYDVLIDAATKQVAGVSKVLETQTIHLDNVVKENARLRRENAELRDKAAKLRLQYGIE